MTITLFQDSVSVSDIRSLLSAFPDNIIDAVVDCVDGNVGYRETGIDGDITYHPMINQEILPYAAAAGSMIDKGQLCCWKKIVLNAADVFTSVVIDIKTLPTRELLLILNPRN